MSSRSAVNYQDLESLIVTTALGWINLSKPNVQPQSFSLFLFETPSICLSSCFGKKGFKLQTTEWSAPSPCLCLCLLLTYAHVEIFIHHLCVWSLRDSESVLVLVRFSPSVLWEIVCFLSRCLWFYAWYHLLFNRSSQQWYCGRWEASAKKRTSRSKWVETSMGVLCLYQSKDDKKKVFIRRNRSSSPGEPK